MGQRIVFGESLELRLPREKLPPQHLLIHNRNNQWLRSQDFQVYMTESAYREVVAHLGENPGIESGGVLVGYPFCCIDDPRITFVIIVGAIRQDSTNRSIGHFTVSPREIASARVVMEQSYPGLIAVGWYHSHPGHGVFLSEQDMQVVRSIYDADWHVTLVVDPLQRKEAFFHGAEGTRLSGWLLLKNSVQSELSNFPAAIVAISVFNRWHQAKESGDLKEAAMLKRYLTQSVLSRREMRHWHRRGFYQNIALHKKPASRRETSSATANFQDDLLASSIDEGHAESLYQEAMRQLRNQDYGVAVSYFRILQERYPGYRPEDVRRYMQWSKSQQTYRRTHNR